MDTQSVQGNVVGLDFGTSTTLVSYSSPTDVARLAQLSPAQFEIPSVAAWDPGLDCLVFGEDAVVLPAEFQIPSSKSMITKRNPSVEVGDKDNRRDVELRDVIVGLLHHAAEQSLQRTPEIGNIFELPIRLGCPADWDGEQRRKLLDCAGEAGFHAVSIDDLRDEPVAAGLAWIEYQKTKAFNFVKKVLVFDMGGGTLDVAVMEVSETHGVSSVSVLASDGTAEAGDSLDEQIANLVKEKSLPHAHVSQLDPIFDQYLLREASNVKHLLSRVEAVPLRLPTPFNDLPEVTLERKDIEELFEPQMTRAKNLVIHVLREARLCVGDSLTAQEVRKIPFEQLREGIDDVFLVGGMTQIPLVRRLLSEFFPDSQVLSQQEFDRRSQGPHQSVALGLVARVEPEKLSLMRPQVEVVLMYEGADGNDETQVLYPAFTKLRQSDQVGNFRFVTESKKVETSKKLEGKIRFRTPSGRLMPVDVFRRDNDDSVMSEPVTYDGLPVALSRYSGVSLSISLQGRIVIRDAAGIDTFFRIHAWPMMKWSGDSSSVPRIQLVPPKGEPLPQYYENDPYHK